MGSIEKITVLDAPLEKLWALYDTVDTLFKLTPPDTKAILEGDRQPMGVGVIFRLRVTKHGLTFPFHARIIAYDPPNGFMDEQIPSKGMFHSWKHEHRFEALPNNQSRLIDRVTYRLPFGPLGEIVDWLIVHRDMEKMFAYRHEKTRELLKSP